MKAALIIRTKLETLDRVPIDGAALLLGRNDDNDVVLDSPRVSRYHARIAWNGAVYSIEDVGSRNGTWLNGVRVEGSTALRHSDLIQIGDLTLVFEIQGKETMKMDAGRGQSPDGLSAREAEILACIARGKTNADVADELVLSVRTVERHLTNIYAKIGARNRSEATAYAHTRGIV